MWWQHKISIVLYEEIRDNICIVYIDNIIVFGKTFPEHLTNLERVLMKLTKHYLKATRDKIHLFLTQLKILGKVANSRGVTTDPDLIKDVVEFPAPISVTQVHSFL